MVALLTIPLNTECELDWSEIHRAYSSIFRSINHCARFTPKFWINTARLIFPNKIEGKPYCHLQCSPRDRISIQKNSHVNYVDRGRTLRWQLQIRPGRRSLSFLQISIAFRGLYRLSCESQISRWMCGFIGYPEYTPAWHLSRRVMIVPAVVTYE